MSLFEENNVTFFEKNNVELKWKKTQTMGAGVKVKAKVVVFMICPPHRGQINDVLYASFP